VRDWPSTGGQPLVIVVDGLDEAEGGFRPPWPQPLPEGVCVVASARPNEAPAPSHLRGWERARPLGLRPFGGSALRRWLKQVSGGVLAQLASDASLVAHLRELTGGLPLYLYYLGEDLAAAVARGDDPAAGLRAAPRGLEQYVAEQLHRLATATELGREVQQLFAVVAAASAPLSEADLERITGMTVFELMQMPTAVTRWFTRARTPDGLLAYDFAHPLLAAEFRKALGGLAVAANDELLADCRRWATHYGRFALTGFARQLRVSDRVDELYELAHDDTYLQAQERAFPARHPALATIATAIDAAAERDDAVTLARLLLRHGEFADALALESPLDALRAGDRDRAFSLAELVDPIPASLWRLLLAWELFDEGHTGAARDALCKLPERPPEELKGEWAVCAATLLLGVWELDPELVERVACAQLHGQGEVMQLSALATLARALVERGRLDEGLRLVQARISARRELLKHVARGLAERGDVGGARRAAAQLGLSHGDRAEALAAAALGAARGGDARSATELFGEARDDLESVERERLPFTLTALAERLAQAGEVEAARSLVREIEDPAQSARAFAAIAETCSAHGGDASADLRDALARLRSAPDARHAVLTVACAHWRAGDETRATALLADVEARGDDYAAADVATAYAECGRADRARHILENLSRSAAQLGRQRAAAALASHGAFQEALDLVNSSEEAWPAKALAEIARHAEARGKPLARDVLGDCLQRHARWVRGNSSVPIEEALAQIAHESAEAGDLAVTRVAAEAVPAGFYRDQALRSLGLGLVRAGEIAAARQIAQTLTEEGERVASAVAGAIAAAELARDGQGSEALARVNAAPADALASLIDAPDDAVACTCIRLLQQRRWLDAESCSKLALALGSRGDFDSAVTVLLPNIKFRDKSMRAVGELSRQAPNDQAIQSLVDAAVNLAPEHLAASALAEIALTGDDRAWELALAFLFRWTEHPSEDAGERSQWALVATDLAVAQRLRGNNELAESLDRIAVKMVAEHDEAELLQRQVELLTRAGRVAEAREVLMAMPNGFDRGHAAIAAMQLSPPQDAGEVVLAAADAIPDRRGAWIPELASLLASAGDARRLKRLWLTGADSFWGACGMCVPLARLHTEHARAIVNLLRGQIQGKRDAHGKAQEPTSEADSDRGGHSSGRPQ
jgi:hypothetical protein